MPPRKRARVSQATSPTPTSNPKTPTPADAAAAAASPTTKSDDHLVHDPWTDDEEIGLFKGLMQWKPTGIHKHFRLLALHQYLLTNHIIHPRNEHTTPAGIWRKLATLYDLEALDEREDARQLSDLSTDSPDDDEGDDDEDVYSEAGNKIHRQDFSLPDDDDRFRELQWRRRFAAAEDEEEENGDESPAVLPEVNLADEPPVRFTPSFSVEPSEAPTPFARGGRARASGTSRARGKAAPAATTRRSARKAESVAEEEEEPEEQVEQEEEESEEEEEVESRENTPARSTRTSAARGRGRGAARARGRGRGRGK